MANFSENKIQSIWEKASIIDGQDPDVYRQDLAGAWIQRDQYGEKGSFGWEVDHMFPESKGGVDDPENLQPLQWENNQTKDNNFPNYNTSVSSNGNKYLKKTQNWKFKDSFIVTVKKLHPMNKFLKDL